MDIERAAKLSGGPVLLALLATVAFCLRWHYSAYHPVMAPDYDGAEYILHARDILAGRPYLTVMGPPGFSVLISLVLPFFKDPHTAGVFVSAAFGSAFCVAVYLLTDELFGRKAALLAGVGTLFFYRLVILSSWVMSEMPFAFFLYMGLYAGLVFRRRGDIPSALAYGALFGGAYLIRPEAMLFFPASALLLAAWELRGKGREKKKFLVRLGLALLVFAALSLPYMAFLRGQLGGWTISGKVQYNIAVDSQGLTAGTDSGTIRYIAGHLAPLIQKYRANIPNLRAALSYNYPVALLVLAAFGMAVSLFKGKHPPLGFFYPSILAGYVCILPFFFVDVRILGPYYPVLLIWAAAGVSYAEDRLFGSPLLKSAARFYPVSIVLALVFMVYSVSQTERFYNDPQQKGLDQHLCRRYLQSAEWLKGNTAPGDKIFSRELLLVFYSGREYINLPDLPPDRLWLLAKEKGARYVIVDDACTWKRKSLGPLIAPFFGDVAAVPGFSRQYTDPESGLIIYRVEG